MTVIEPFVCRVSALIVMTSAVGVGRVLPSPVVTENDGMPVTCPTSRDATNAGHLTAAEERRASVTSLGREVLRTPLVATSLK